MRAFKTAVVNFRAHRGFFHAAGLAFSFVRRARQVVWIAIGLLVLVAMGWMAKRAELQATVSTGTSSSTST